MTNGTIIPEDALGLSARILTELLDLFTNLTEIAKSTEVMKEADTESDERILDRTIEELDLSVRSYNCLKRAGICLLYTSYSCPFEQHGNWCIRRIQERT